MRGQIILSHGSDSGPDATKVGVLAEHAEALGWRAIRPDYRREDQLGHAGSVGPRLEKLVAAIDACVEPPVLVGSSMGAFVSALAALERKVAGLFLLATPPAIPGCGRALDLPAGVPTLLLHGWRDEVCPLPALYAFAGARRLPLLLLDDDHRLGASVEAIAAQFRQFLDPIA
ncbi:alpha/beta hydrolase [Fulvimonas soli]|jgi:pimeloyl-ACP methyl ester carboxylesterase|uniref:Putative alpha/beta-hydrolase family hydrolase n=1 Tax=Fulvimonas soli TaxID=155197 RepID=A0A316IJJ5_9GAMM|nr:alpha/beta fold hydrolase [Fulvimonas soli]PWK92674.1 putative alpha/beta-hydrolase family hydrolase [Fulvimonas soli]TNY25169.1 alpha/beta hydrolase [Fulvimonas soli]